MLFESCHPHAGRLSVAPQSCVARENLGLTIVYTTQIRLTPGACIRVQIPLACPPPQSRSPLAPGFVSTRCEKARFAIAFSRRGNPKDDAYVARFGHNIYLTLLDGTLQEGDSLTLLYGAAASARIAAFGNPDPTPAPFFSGDHPISWALDPDGQRTAPYSGMYIAQEELTLRVLPGKPVKRIPLRPARGLTLTAVDDYGNPSDDDSIQADLPIANNLPPEAREDETRIFFGDIHCHSRFSDGLGLPEDCYRFARDKAGLDFCSVTDHACEVSDAEWENLREAAEKWNEPGRFVTLLGYECSHPHAGDKNLFFPGGDAPFLREQDMVAGSVTPISALVPAWKERGALMMAHLHSRHLEAYLDNDLCRLVEIYSNWGCCECADADPAFIPALRSDFAGQYVHDALRMGWRAGFTGGSDDHMGRPGWSGWHRVEKTYRGGLTGVYAQTLTREAIFEALWNRHTFATTGVQMRLFMTCEGALPGSVLAARPIVFRICVRACGPIQRVELLQNGRAVFSHDGAGESEWKAELPWTPEPGSCYLRVRQTDGHCGWISPFYFK